MKSEEERLVKKRLHGRWRKVVSVLACIVVFCTTYALILPAITKEKATDCGIEEHTHGSECFSEENELICTKQEHTHGPECYVDPETEAEMDMQADADGEKNTGIVGQMQGEADAGMDVAAEADAAPETEMEAMAEEAAAEAAPIAEGSTLITGDSVGVSGLSSYSAYLIVAEDSATGTYYALSSDGSSIQVDYDPTTKKVSVGQDVNLADIQWYSYDVGGSGTTRTAGLRNVRTGNYLYLADNQFTATSKRTFTIKEEPNTDQAKIYYETGVLWLKQQYYLGFSTSAKTFNVTTSSSNAAAVRLVAYVSEDIPVEGSGTHPEVEYNFPNNKTIDYLGDGEKNPDTDVQGEDLYRLYLDITGRMEPTDLLIVVDRSSSMKDNQDMQVEGSTQKKERYKVVNELLNGTESGSTATDEGLISRVLKANPENRVAVCSFEGKVTENNSSTGLRIMGSKDTGYTYTMDSEISRGWYTKENYNNVFIDITPPNWQGTNYEAGLLSAQELFEQAKDEPDKKKIMIFISDGVPTYYIDQKGNRQGDSFGSADGSEGPSNDKACREPSKRAFDAFQKAYPDVIVHTVAIYGTDELGATKNYDPEVLQYMSDNSGGSFIEATDSGTLLKIGKVIYPGGVTITDPLSVYVDYYNTPDLKVVRSHPEYGTEILCEKGVITEKGANNILESVGYDSATRKVTLKFDHDFIMQSGWTYTLSFNVKATKDAYDDYAKNGYTDVEGNPVTGDVLTDYKNTTNDISNDTSSGKPGFYSNTNAQVSYFIGNDSNIYTQPYDNPVIQVDKCKVVLTKKNDAGDLLQNVSFNLKRGSDVVGTYTTGADGKLEIPITALITGDYTLEEAATPEGYLPAGSAIIFSVAQGMITHGTAPDPWTWETDPEKNILDGNNYVKNNTYEYGLTLVNHMQPKKLLLKKVDADGKPLEGAVFTLYKDCSSDTADAKLFRITVGDKEETVWGTVVQTGLTSEGAEAVLYEGELGGGTYYLVETSAPDGYHRLTEPVVIKVAGDGVSFSYSGTGLQTETTGTDPVVYSAKVQNISGTRLPETGGSGREGYITGGLALMLCAGILLYDREVRKRKGAGTR